jgi:hypothetical protein
MGRIKPSNINLRIIVLAIVGAILVLSPQTALAVQSSVYENFTKCPTGAPAMNDPANEGAICVAGAVRHGSIRLGNFGVPINSPLRFQFALVGGGEEIHVVPESTSFDAGEPFMIPNPFYAPPTQGTPPAIEPPSTPAPKKRRAKGKSKCKPSKCKHRKCKRTGRKKGRCKKQGSKKRPNRRPQNHQIPQPNPSISQSTPPDPNAAMIKVIVESAGEVRNLELSALAGEPGTAFELPIKLHLEGAGLGPACYIGSDSEPVVLAPEAVSEPSSFQFGMDPNGFNVRLLGIGGVNLEDTSFSVPGASGCGAGALDAPINALMGLPAAPGSSKALLADILIEMAAAEFDGTPPEGGAELQAAFEAAQ